MDERYLGMLELCRPLLYVVNDLEQLLPYLQADDAVTPEELGHMRTLTTTQARADHMIDLVSQKGPQAFSALCVALESTYPHILTAMFTGKNNNSLSAHRDISLGSTLGPPPNTLPPPIPGLAKSDSTSSKDSQSTPLSLDTEEEGHTQALLASAVLADEVTPSSSSSASGRSLTARPISLNDYDVCQDSVSLLKAELKLVSKDHDLMPEDCGKPLGHRSDHSKPIGHHGDHKGHHLDHRSHSDQSKPHSDHKPLGHHGDHSKSMGHHSDYSKPPGHMENLSSHRPSHLDPYKMGPPPEPLSKPPGLPSPLTTMGLASGPVSISPGQSNILGHDYDRIKAECDRMNNELQSLEKKYDQAIQASNTYRQKYIVTKDKLEAIGSELDHTKAQCHDLDEDKSRLCDEVEQLKRQHREAMSGSSSFEGFSAIYDQQVARYDSLKLDYDALRKQYTDTIANLNSANTKADRSQEETERLRKQYDQLVTEKNKDYKERKILQQHVTSAIQAANREKNDLLRELQDMKKERDMYRKKVNQTDSHGLQMSKDVGRLKKERDAVVHEYTLIMSERDNVHKEMEQLQDKLTATQKKLEQGDKERKSLKDELDNYQREVANLMEQRDRTIKQLNDMKDKYGERRHDSMDRDLVKELDRVLPERGSGRRDKEMMERRDHDAKELENLRKELERMQSEHKDTLQEKEDCKRRCDWAFTERDKIVKERESIRTLCDKLRHERDNAVSKLIEALRDTDELKKQKSDAVRELKEVKEKYESLLEREARKGQLHAIGHNHSHDSAIDADLQEWETETLTIEIGGLLTSDLGVDLVGGREDPQFPDNAVFVSSIRQDSCAFGKLRVNDQLVKVDNVDITNVEKPDVYQAIHNAGNSLQMVVRRRRMISTRSIMPVHISLTDRELGVQLEMGLFVSRILPGCAAAREGSLAIGDRVLSVNGQSTENMTPSEVTRLVQSQGDHVTFNVIKYSFTPHSSVMLSSTPSSGHNLTESSPDGISLSPRSPRMDHRSWASPSPDSSTKANLSLKCSGSQTDSLDSPQPSVRSGWSDQDKSHDYTLTRRDQDKPHRDFTLTQPGAEKTHRDFKSIRTEQEGTQREYISSRSDQQPTRMDYTTNRSNQDKSYRDYTPERAEPQQMLALHDYNQPRSELDKPPHRDYSQTRGSNIEYDRKRGSVQNQDMEYKRTSKNLDYEGSRPDDSHRHRSHDADSHRSHERSHDFLNQRSHDSHEARRSHDFKNQQRPLDHTEQVRTHDSQEKKHSYDFLDQGRTHDFDQRRTFNPHNTNDEVEKRILFDKAVSRIQKPSHTLDRAGRDARCKSGHPFFNMTVAEQTTEDQVIEELNAVITQYEPNSVTNGKSKEKRRRDKIRRENGGTWPKCHSHGEQMNPGWLPPVVHKNRTPLPNVIKDGIPSYQHQDGGMPPTPPERSDSFKRSASIKHSPQSSDSSKYYSSSSKTQSSYHSSPPKHTSRISPQNSTHMSPPSSNHMSTQNTNRISPQNSSHLSPQNVSHMSPHSSSHLSPQSQTSDDSQHSHMDNSWGSPPSQKVYDKIPSSSSHHYPHSESSSSHHYVPISSSESGTQESLDLTVRSANSDIGKYVKKPNRPTSAPNQSRSAKMKAQMRAEERRRDSQESYPPGHRSSSHEGHPHGRSSSRSREVDQKLQEIAEMLSRAQTSPEKPVDYVAQKPKTLPVQPMYSPRPLPHTGSHSITPSQPPPYNHSSNNKYPMSPTGSGPLSPRDKVTVGSMKAVQVHPTSVPAHTQVLRSPQAVFQVANSQLVGGQGVAMPTTPSPVSSVGGGRYSSQTSHYLRGSGSSVLNSSIPEVESENSGVYHVRDRFSSTPSPSPSQQSSNFDHSVTTSDDFPYEILSQRGVQGRHAHHVPQVEGSSTFPNRRPHHHQERIRIPSNHSMVSPHRSVASSFERVSDRSSPVSPAYVVAHGEYSHLPPGTSHSLPSTKRAKRPRQGETREIKVEKSIEPLGIQIQSGNLGGIFVSSVSDNSLASRAGLAVGDQLLEVCGINMRAATKDLAASVLRQCGGSINMLVQYNPNKYQEEGNGSSGPSTESSASNTPEISQNRKDAAHRISNETLTSDTVSPQTISPSSISPKHSVKPADYPPMEPRFVMLKKPHPHDSLGVTLVGGNAVGIFIRSVQPNSVSGSHKGLNYGDQILEYNGINFRNVTHEQAFVEISKPAEVVSILAQYNIQRLNKILDQPGDALYIRALFDHQAGNEGELSFSKNDILFVDNTMYKGMMGVWLAWKVDDSGNKLQYGTIPSKSRLEDDLSLKRSISEMGEDELSKTARRGSGSARRSFFRKKKHQRSNSRDSRELNSFSDASINSDSVPFLDDGSVLTFERVERLDSKVCRPVLILAPLAEPLINKLTSESPDKYCRCEAEVIKATVSSLETGQNEGLFVDFKPRQDGQFECITVQSVKEIITKNRHCMLNAHPDAIEHLHKANIYPIVLYVKHKTSKEIREVKDTRFLPEKLSNKSAKEFYDTFQKYEQKYKRLFSEAIPGGNLAYMCRMIKTAIDTEQKKTFWVPSGYL